MLNILVHTDIMRDGKVAMPRGTLIPNFKDYDEAKAFAVQYGITDNVHIGAVMEMPQLGNPELN